MKDVRYVDDIVLCKEDPVLVISRELLGTIKKEVHANDLEIGGILLGYKLLRKNEYRITCVSYPYENDVSSKANFYRIDKRHNIFLRQHHKIDKSITYLGDWHSHPESNASSSTEDKSTYLKNTKLSRTSAKHLFFLIVGRNLGVEIYSKYKPKKIKTMYIEFEKEDSHEK